MIITTFFSVEYVSDDLEFNLIFLRKKSTKKTLITIFFALRRDDRPVLNSGHVLGGPITPSRASESVDIPCERTLFASWPNFF